MAGPGAVTGTTAKPSARKDPANEPPSGTWLVQTFPSETSDTVLTTGTSNDRAGTDANASSSEERTMQKITPYLWFDGKAEEATNFYVSIFRNSKIGTVTRAGPGPDAPVCR